MCEIKGGYPKAYTDSAIKDGLCESVSSAPATREFAASAVYNSLSSTALVITGIVTVAPPERGGITQNYKNQPYGFLSVMNISVADGEIISAENGKLKVKVTEVQECINDIADEYAEGPDIVKIPRLKAGEIYEMDVKYSDMYESYAEALKNGTVPAARLLIKDNSEKTDGNQTKAFTLLSEFKGEADQ